MSIENAIQENTAALRALTAALAGGALPANEPAAKKPRGRPVAGETAPAQTASAPAETPAPSQPVQATTTQPTPSASAPAAAVSSGDAPTFKQAADALVKLAETVSRDAAVALLTKFGATKAPEIKPADFAAFIADANAQIAAKAAPASGASGLV